MTPKMDLDSPLEPIPYYSIGSDSLVANAPELIVPTPDLSRRLSYSSQTLIHSCPRKFELYKLGVGHSVQEDPSQSITFQYGHTIGTGVQTLFSTGGDIDACFYEAFLGWKLDLFAENPYQNKDFWECLYALQVLAGMIKSGFLQDWKVLQIQQADGTYKPAAELSFRISFPDDYTYIGYVDLVLEHDFTGEVMVLEVKTTSAVYVKPEQYKNSAQAIGYSIILDHIHKDLSSYKVLYLPYLSKARRYEPMEFTKMFSQRARWISELLLDIDTIEMYRKANLFPMHGESCLSFGKPCQYFGICTMNNSMMARNAPQKTNSNSGSEIYDYEVTIQELIESQLAGVDDLVVTMPNCMYKEDGDTML